MRTLLLSPIGPERIGNGLAHRARQWRLALSMLGEVLTVVVPVVGPADEGAADVVVAPVHDVRTDVPRLARGCTRELGAGVARQVGPVDVVVCLRSYLGEVGVGLAAAIGSALIVDLDDDDADFHAQRGDAAEADRYRALVDRLAGEVDLLVAAGPMDGCVVVPNSVAIPARMRPLAGDVARVVMVANFGYDPNAEGAQWLLDEVVPIVRSEIPDVALDLVGPGSERFAGVGLGVVEDLAPIYAAASVAVAPVLTGSGTRTKILEAWAHGVPVVSTTTGVAGLGARDGVDVAVADDADGFASRVVTLLLDGERNHAIGAAGRARCEASFESAAVATATARLVETVAGRSVWIAAPVDGLEVTPTDDGVVVLDRSTSGVHHLNASAMAVFLLADGDLTDDAIAIELADLHELDEPPVDLVRDAVTSLVAAGLLRRTRRTVARS